MRHGLSEVIEEALFLAFESDPALLAIGCIRGFEQPAATHERLQRRSRHDLCRWQKARVLHREVQHGAERDRLLAFFVTANHLRDALGHETTIGRATIEDAVSADPSLALLADLANVDKHATLNRPPRSGYVPAIIGAAGEQSGSGREGWRLRVTIRHGAHTMDGIDCARDAAAAWHRLLGVWGLL